MEDENGRALAADRHTTGTGSGAGTGGLGGAKCGWCRRFWVFGLAQGSVFMGMGQPQALKRSASELLFDTFGRFRIRLIEHRVGRLHTL